MRMKRAQRVKAVVALRDAGLLHREIAKNLDISLSYVRKLLYDPDGNKQYVYQRRWYGENRERVLEQCREYAQTEHAKALRFERRKTGGEREATRRYREQNREHYEATERAYRERNKAKRNEAHAHRRARKRATASVSFMREEIIARDRSRCHICGKHVPRAEITLDHLIPLSKGGAHTPENVAVAHGRCNSRRGAGLLPAQLRLVG